MSFSEERRGTTLIVLFLRMVGVRFCYFWARFVLLYYFLTGHKARKGIEGFYARLGQKALGLRASRLAYRNFLFFTATMIDRLAAGHGLYTPKFTFALPYRERWLENGLILVGAHFGDWTFSSQAFAELRLTRQGPVHIVMDLSQSPRFQEQLAKLSKEGDLQALKVIDASKGGLEFVLAIKQALDANSIVCFLGDRPSHLTRDKAQMFLGEPATFPVGPFDLAVRLKRPVVTFYCIKKTYSPNAPIEVWLEEIWDGKTSMTLDGLMQAYTENLEKMVSIAPHHWFNFFDFWAPPALPSHLGPQA